MKKRKELNALIGLGDSKRKKTKKGSGHRLLRTEPPDSESDSSSDDDEFNSLSSGANFGKRSYTQCCNVCYPLFLFIILAACVMACAGLIWMQIALKEDLDALKEKLHSMESSQKVSFSEIPKLSEDLKNKERKLDDIENGDKGLSRLWSNLTEMNRKISVLDLAVNHLKTNLKSAADLIKLPTTVEELQKSVATIGSTLTSVQHDMNTMQSALENLKKDDDTKKTMAPNRKQKTWVDSKHGGGDSREAQERKQVLVLLDSGKRGKTGGVNKSVSHLYHDKVENRRKRVQKLLQPLKSPDITDLRKAVSEANKTEQLQHTQTDEQIHMLLSTVADLHQRVSSLENGSKQSAQDNDGAAQVVTSSESSGAVNEATTTKATPGDMQEQSTPLTESRTSRRPRFLTPVRSKRNAETSCPKTVFLPGVSSLKDLEEIFQQAGTGRLTHRGLSKVFGTSTPSARTMECFDKDGDRMYSLTELRAAVGL